MERHEMALGQVWAHMQDWHANGRGGPCVLGDMAQERLLCKGSMSALVTKVCRSRTAVWTAARDGTVRENGAVRLDRTFFDFKRLRAIFFVSYNSDEKK
jgi:hypothetical protein